MSQYSTVLEDSNGITFLDNINKALETLNTLHSGSDEPPELSAYMLWVDTTNGVIKQRNSSNDGWVTKWNLSDGELATIYQLNDKAPYASIQGFKNLIKNGNFTINQRGYVSGTNTTTSNQYTFDRWRIHTSGQNATFSTTNGIVTVTAPASGIEQVIDKLDNLGGSFVLSYTGTATATVSESSDNVTYTTLTAVNGVYTITGGKYVKINLAGGTAKQVQFEQGIIATPFENRPYGLELELCQRYYWRRGSLYEAYGAGNGTYLTTAIGVLQFPVQMRVAPAMGKDQTSLSFNLMGAGGGNVGVTNLSFSNQSTLSAMWNATVATGMAGGQGTFLWGNFSSTYIEASAEL